MTLVQCDLCARQSQSRGKFANGRLPIGWVEVQNTAAGAQIWCDQCTAKINLTSVVLPLAPAT